VGHGRRFELEHTMAKTQFNTRRERPEADDAQTGRMGMRCLLQSSALTAGNQKGGHLPERVGGLLTNR